MPGEIYYSGLSGNARAAAVLSQLIAVKLADRVSLFNHPSIVRFDNMNARGSTVLQVPVISWGADAMSAVAENASSTNTALTSTNVNITISRQAIQRTVSDLAQLTATGVPFDVTLENLAADSVAAFEKRITQMITALSTGFSTSVGSTGVDLSVTTFYNAIFALQLQANENMTAVLHNQQFNDLMSSLRSESGPGQYLQNTQAALEAKAPGSKGFLFGVEVITSNTCPAINTNADYSGLMFSRGAIGLATATAAPIVGSTTIIPQSPIVVEIERTAAAATSTLVATAYAGVAELDDARGVQIVSDL
jgi:hypothetical protein